MHTFLEFVTILKEKALAGYTYFWLFYVRLENLVAKLFSIVFVLFCKVNEAKCNQNAEAASPSYKHNKKFLILQTKIYKVCQIAEDC